MDIQTISQPAVTQDMVDAAPQLGKDTVSLDGTIFNLKAHIYRLTKKEAKDDATVAREFKGESITFNSQKGRALSPFLYEKPSDILHYTTCELDEDFREDYYPLGIVGNAYKSDNHMSQADEALFCAVRNSEGKWETRYFPRNNILAKTWDEAVKIIEENSSAYNGIK